MIDSKREIRCAIYTRKSTDEGLDQEFNSLDAQRESAEAYITSQKNEGWVCLPTHYNDGGFTGGNMDRPALKRLVDDIEAGKIDCVIVYKVDRLSRSLLDFTRIMETFDRHGVTFVSVTQAFNTTNSMGRLTLNILLSFAQFEREIISERTRDKMAAARRKGKYVGGTPILGYDVDRAAKRMVVNHREAGIVRQVFEMYLERQSLLATVSDLDRRDIVTKKWTTKAGKPKGGRVFNKNTLYGLLTNVAYIGKVKYKDEIHDGQHEAIVDDEIFEQVQRMLKLNYRTGGSDSRNKFGALLKGKLSCVPCGCAMIPTHTTKGNRRYRYYVCTNAQKRGWTNCPSPSIPAEEIERFVIDQIREIAQEPKLIGATLDEAQRLIDAQLSGILDERKGIESDLQSANVELQSLITQPREPGITTRQADLIDRVRLYEQRLAELRDEEYRVRGDEITEDEVATALQQFDPVWEVLSPREQTQLIDLLVEKVEYHSETDSVAVTLRPTGFRTLNDQAELEGECGMNGLRVEAKMHFKRKRKGRKTITQGDAPATPPGRMPRVTKLMALAIRFEQLIRDGVVADQAELARLGHVTRARMTQIMNLLHLAPDIQEAILFLPRVEFGRDPITERELRSLVASPDWRKQRKLWESVSGQ